MAPFWLVAVIAVGAKVIRCDDPLPLVVLVVQAVTSSAMLYRATIERGMRTDVENGAEIFVIEG